MTKASIKRLLKQAAKTAICLMLCVALVWGYSYREPTEAHATAVGVVVGAVAVAAAVAALGICVSGVTSNQDYGAACQEIWDKMDSGIKNKVTCAAVAAGAVGVMQYNLTTEFLTAVGTTLKNSYDEFLSSAALATLPISQSSTTCNYTWNGFYKALFNSDVQAVGDKWSDDIITTYKIYSALPILSGISSCTVGTQTIMVKKSGETGIYISVNNGVDWPSYSFRCMSTATYGYVIAAQVGKYIKYYIVSNAECAGSQMNLVQWYSVLAADSAIPAAPGHDVYGIPGEDIYADGYSALNHTVSDVVDHVGNAVGVLNPDGTKSIPIPVPSTGVSTQTQSQTQSDALQTDISDAASTELNKTTNTGKNTSLPKPSGLPDLSLPMLLTRKFPFSLPWDLYASVKMLAATPTTPVYTVPFIHGLWGINQDITIDMTKMEPVAVVCRWGFSAMWVVGLIFLTRKLIWK